jgi:hypothetical protein
MKLLPKNGPLSRARINGKARLRLLARSWRLARPRPVAEGTIVSFTSIPSRLPAVHLVVDSILLQSVLPERIVLYLSKSDFPDRSLPRQLQARIGERFDVRWCEDDLKSHGKLVHALVEFPEKTIVTIDDDKIYAADMLERLLATARRHPGSIVFRNGELLVVEREERRHRSQPTSEPSLWYLPKGVGGILYPPHSLADDVTDSELFLRLCPYSDDLWFKAMALLKQTPSVPTPPSRRQDHSLWFRWVESLEFHNRTLRKLDMQAKALFDYYGIVPGKDPGDTARLGRRAPLPEPLPTEIG